MKYMDIYVGWNSIIVKDIMHCLYISNINDRSV